MNATVEYEGGKKFVVTSGGHRVISDQPAANGGAGEGMSPPELLLASLGACAGYYAAEYLNARRLDSGLKIEVQAEKTQNPTRLGSFRIAVALDGALEERHVQGVSRAVHNCLIHNTLLHPPEIEIQVEANRGVAIR